MGCGQVNKYHLCGLLRCRPFPDVVHIFRTDGNLSGIAVRQHRIDQPLIQCQLPAIVGNDQHVVLIGIHLFIAHLFCPLGKTGDDFFLLLRGFQHHIVVFRLRHRQLQHIRRLNIRNFLEHGHQLREVVELGKPGLGSIAGTLRGQFNGGDSLSKGGGPGIKMEQVILFQGVVLQIFLHGIKLHHGVADWRAGGKYHAPASGQLI